MSEEDMEIVLSAEEGGIAAIHPKPEVLPILVGPSTGKEFNRVRYSLVAVACVQLRDIVFQFDSSFVMPDVTTQITELRHLLHRHPDSPLSIFGHADPIGDDTYNKHLSGRRATAVYALLTRKTELWEEIFTHPLGADDWGQTAVQTMLDTVGPPANAADQSGDGHQSAVREFQEAHALPVDGIAGPNTRKKLFRIYMDQLCGPDLELNSQHFLARGVDQGGKGDYQGCSEFNPLLMFSKADQTEFSRPENKGIRDALNRPNRRVVIFLFRRGTWINPQRWPCPRAKEGITGCQNRFFSDASLRRSYQAERREYKKTRDTFACRFYDRIATLSPCENPGQERKVRVVFDDRYLGFFQGEVRLTFADGSTSSAKTDENGTTVVDASRGVFVDAEWVQQGAQHQRRVFLRPPPVGNDEGVWQRLVNMGFSSEIKAQPSPPGPEQLALAVVDFQVEYRLEPTAVLDDATRRAVFQAHDLDSREWRDREWVDEPVIDPNDPQPKSKIT